MKGRGEQGGESEREGRRRERVTGRGGGRGEEKMGTEREKEVYKGERGERASGSREG